MYDTKNYNESYDEIFDFFHNQINSQIHNYNMDNYIFIIPPPIILLILSSVKQYGSSFDTYSTSAYNYLSTYDGNNNLDTV